MTFCATINAIIHAGGIPIIIDIDPQTGNIDHNLIQQKITKKTKFIIPVHYAGLPCEMTKIMQIAKKINLLLLKIVLMLLNQSSMEKSAEHLVILAVSVFM